MDLLKLEQALDKFNNQTLPALDKVLDADLKQLVTDLHELMDRLNGATITVNIPPRKEQQ